MFKKVLVANRGEIACRVLATLRERGIPGVAIYSDEDAQALHVRHADEAVAIGPAEPARSYLDIEAILGAARETGADAIHPGYGFLAENAGFARAVESAGLTFIGPTPEQALIFGDKRHSRATARRAGIPVVPGSEELRDLRKAAGEIGFPVFVKAALGGGGKGMQRVESLAELDAAVDTASRLGASAFGDASVYLERAIDRPRHVEVQIVGDGKGRVVHLFERECSLQRRHQKVIEETPSPGISHETRRSLWDAAVRLGESVAYRGAGTVEFLVAASGEYYFLEMNTRLQVEHPITEWVTGQDLVWWQLAVAAEGHLPRAQEEITGRGHAAEARLYAEDPASEFLPQAGRLVRVEFPRAPWIRVDTGVESGSLVPAHYDPILAKVSAWGETRKGALGRLHTALGATVMHGVTTNRAFLAALAKDRAVWDGHFDVEYLEREFLLAWAASRGVDGVEMALAAAAIAEALGVVAQDAGAAVVPRPGARAAADPFAALGAWRQPGLGEP
jgi:acetyl-CoA/propionyl-CoA carboxylase biotin carboxyl carrier protein